MDDLVKRLRADPNWLREDYSQSEAADLIEAQAARIAELEATLRELLNAEMDAIVKRVSGAALAGGKNDIK